STVSVDVPQTHSFPRRSYSGIRKLTGLPSRSEIEHLMDKVDFARDRDSVHYQKPPSCCESHDNLLAAYEELSVAEEELRAQHEAIIEAQGMLEVQRNRYHTLFDFAPDPYVVTDELGVIEEANLAA